MIHARHWTNFDTAALLLLFALCMRVFGSAGADPAPEDWFAAPALTTAYVPAELSHPLPVATEWAASHGPARIDGAARCIALAEIRRRNACGAEHSRTCRMADLNRRITEFSLLPRVRESHWAETLPGRIDRYADAYATLPDVDSRPMRASSQLIRARDGAICREYLRFAKVLPHGSEVRQSRRTVQESSG